MKMGRSGKLKTAIFLDRDGVINKSIIKNNLPYSPKQKNNFVIIDGVKEAISIFNSLNFIPVVITNQPDVSRGIMTKKMVDWQHSRLYEVLGIENYFTCYHDDSDFCECRKPKAGLIKEASKKLNIDIKKSFLVGDRWKDIKAGQNAGCSCFFIDYQYNEKEPEPPFQRVNSLLEAARIISGGINDK